MAKATNVLLLLFIFCLSSCNEDKDDVTACGVNDPINDLAWLNEIVTMANTDQTGNYIGTIWLINYEGQESIVTDMALGSGGIKYWIFDCSGELAKVKDYTNFSDSLRDSEIIYSNFP